MKIFNFVNFVWYLLALSVTGLYRIDDRIINEYGTVHGMRIEGCHLEYVFM
jgi:hypothetical protein